MKRFPRFFPALASLVFIVSAASADARSVVVYSARNAHLIEPVFDLYTRETGNEVRFVTDKDPVLLQRIQAEGETTPADLLITVDAGNLWHAAREGILAPVDSAVLAANIPDHLRDPENRWFGLSVRARTIVFSTERVQPAELSTYEDLAAPKWKGRLVLRTSKKVYNQSLVAMLIETHGEARAGEIVRGWVANLAAPPFASDNDVMEAIAAGQGDVGIVNTYYFGRLAKEKPDVPLALFWPNQGAGGVHVNVSGAGVVAASRNKEAAVALLEWLSTSTAQQIFADVNLEYPANPAVAVDPSVATWGGFEQNRINLANAGENQVAAIRLMDREGYR
jgi:iron(III) transport system substrate-binding protein